MGAQHSERAFFLPPCDRKAIARASGVPGAGRTNEKGIQPLGLQDALQGADLTEPCLGQERCLRHDQRESRSRFHVALGRMAAAQSLGLGWK